MRFLLVDRITALEDDRRIEGIKTVAMAEDYLEWHFPERPILPGVLVLEAFAQLAGWLEAASSGFERWALLDRVRSGRWLRFAVPGDVVHLALERVPAEGDAPPDRRVLRGESEVDGIRQTAVEIEVATVPLADLFDPDEARRRYDALRDPHPGRKGDR